MQYVIQFLEPKSHFAQREDAEKAPAYWGAWGAYIQTMQESGIIVNGAGLQPPETATTVRVRDGKRQVHDGPYAESKEMLGGFFVVEVPDLDVALEWAARSPSASYGSVEVRPVFATHSRVTRMSADASSAAALESIARSAYGQLVALLAARSGDLGGAEDALGEAFLAALRQWPRDGIPENPQGWIVHVAQRRLMDQQRRQHTRNRFADDLEYAAALAQPAVGQGGSFPDERLKLLFVCAHPAIDAAARAPLSLQLVLGLDAQRIASAFLVSPAAMSQRLVRAKTKIQRAKIPFQEPEKAEWPERFEFVLDAIYVAFNAGWESAFDVASSGRGLAEEAIWLGRLLVQLVPDDAEAPGLLALMLHCHARRAARRGEDGAFVPLPEQDTRRWSRPLMEEAEDLIQRAARLGRPGRFQLEAAIQSVHAGRAQSGEIAWAAVENLYARLIQLTPAIGARIGHAVALGEVGRAEAGLEKLDGLDAALVREHQPYWVARAHLLRSLQRRAESAAAYQRAIGLTEDAAVRAFLSAEAASFIAP